MKNQNVTAVVIGAGSYNDLGMIRSLGEAGVRSVYLCTNQPILPIWKSRYICTFRIINIEKELIPTLIQTANACQRKLCLFPTSDEAAEKIDRSYLELSDIAFVPNAKGNLLHVMDKETQGYMALSSGFDVPSSVRVNLAKDDNPLSIGFPCIVKPLKSVSGSKDHICVCQSNEELSQCLNTYRSANEMDVIIQKFIESKGKREICVTGVGFPDNNVIIAGAVEKYRLVGNGSTSYGKFTPKISKEIRRTVTSFIEKSSYCGIFDLECFIDDNDTLTFIECNFRNGAYGYAVTHAGVNMPYLFYEGIQGKVLPHTQPKEAVFMEERLDYLNVKSGQISLKTWMRDVLRTNVFLYSSLRDIGPMIRIPYSVKKLFMARD